VYEPKHVARNTIKASNKLRVVYDYIILQFCTTYMDLSICTINRGSIKSNRKPARNERNWVLCTSSIVGQTLLSLLNYYFSTNTKITA